MEEEEKEENNLIRCSSYNYYSQGCVGILYVYFKYRLMKKED